MRTQLMEELGIEFPILAFSHCRDVVAAVTNAGASGPRRRRPLARAARDRPRRGSRSRPGQALRRRPAAPRSTPAPTRAGIDPPSRRRCSPSEQQSSSTSLLENYEVPALPGEQRRIESAGSAAVSHKGDEPLLDVAFAHPIRLVASALGPAAAGWSSGPTRSDVVVAALAGTTAARRAPQPAGVDLIVAQGTEAGGHTGEIATMVLVPEVVDAVAPARCWPPAASAAAARSRPRWRSAPRACGAARCGSPPRRPRPSRSVKEKFLAAASSRHGAVALATGKPARMLRTRGPTSGSSPAPRAAADAAAERCSSPRPRSGSSARPPPTRRRPTARQLLRRPGRRLAQSRQVGARGNGGVCARVRRHDGAARRDRRAVGAPEGGGAQWPDSIRSSQPSSSRWTCSRFVSFNTSWRAPG